MTWVQQLRSFFINFENEDQNYLNELYEYKGDESDVIMDEV